MEKLITIDDVLNIDVAPWEPIEEELTGVLCWHAGFDSQVVIYATPTGSYIPFTVVDLDGNCITPNTLKLTGSIDEQVEAYKTTLLQTIQLCQK